MTEFIERLRREPESTRTALAMVEAVRQHIDDLRGDDPGDAPQQEGLLLREAQRHADQLARVLRTLTSEVRS